MTAIVKALFQFHCRVKSIGYTAQMDNYKKRRLGIFNRINFLGQIFVEREEGKGSTFSFTIPKA